MIDADVSTVTAATDKVVRLPVRKEVVAEWLEQPSEGFGNLKPLEVVEGESQTACGG